MTTNRTLADRINDAKNVLDAAKDAYEALRDEAIATGRDLIEGDECDVKITLSQRSVLDEDKLFNTYGITADQLKLFNACKKDGASFAVVKVVAKKSKAA